MTARLSHKVTVTIPTPSETPRRIDLQTRTMWRFQLTTGLLADYVEAEDRHDIPEVVSSLVSIAIQALEDASRHAGAAATQEMVDNLCARIPTDAKAVMEKHGWQEPENSEEWEWMKMGISE